MSIAETLAELRAKHSQRITPLLTAVGRSDEAERGSIYQGQPCRYGHDGRRFRRSDGCVQCADIRNAETRLQTRRKA